MRKLENLFAVYELGRKMGSLRSLLKSKMKMDSDIGQQSIDCIMGLKYLVEGHALELPRSRESALRRFASLNNLLDGDPVVADCRQQYGEDLNPYFTTPIKTDMDTFQIAMPEKMKLLPVFSVEEKGNLSIDRLIEGASLGYSPLTLALIDDFVKREIDEAGRCLAFARASACGFHVLRAVEITIKAYVLAATGKLPNPKHRT